jgi:UDP-glucuronate 4-epimerase
MTNQHKVLVTGAAGFIGFFLIQRLVADGHSVVGVDNMNSYYDVELKHARLAVLKKQPDFTFIKADLSDRTAVEKIFSDHRFTRVVHLAAQAGVRFSLTDPHEYIPANLSGFFNVLHACKEAGIKHFVYASSSSVYGANKKVPFAEEDATDHPVNLYAATKRANELMAWSYAHIYDLPSTGLRFFTVYGPWGRPDMAYFHFTRSILARQTIKVFNHGNMKRDFTYIDDIIESVVRIIDIIPKANNAGARARVFNIGRNKPENLMKIISVLEEALGVKANMEMLPMQPGEMLDTYADSTPLITETGFSPSINIEEGIAKFVEWYRQTYPN